MSSLIERLASLERCIAELQNRTTHHPTDADVYTPKLPIESREELELVEAGLADNNAAKQLVSHAYIWNCTLRIDAYQWRNPQVERLKNIGGKSNAQAIRLAGAACFGPTITMEYTWHGMRGKQSLKMLNVARCIEDALASRGISHSDVATEMGNWLRHSCDRNKKKLLEFDYTQDAQIL